MAVKDYWIKIEFGLLNMFMKLSLIIRIIPVLFLVGVAGCQQQPGSASQYKAVPPDIQLKQLSSVVAGTKYLKYKCNRSDLPDDNVILGGAARVAKQRGWDSVKQTDLLQQSEALYLSLIRDSTPEQMKCSSFNQRLVPFISELQREEVNVR
ncbi:MAG: type II secretion system pilot lipoprotein GspS [Hafnia sp.]